MGLHWKHKDDGTYEAQAREGVYRIAARREEWCLEKPHPVPGRIGGFRSPAEAMAWGEDLHLAATGPRVRTPQPAWPTVDEFARVVDVQPTVLRAWIAVHAGGSTSPRRRIDPTTQERIKAFFEVSVVR
ncbi:hypothetical protein L603_004900000060 [Cellulosimicrobium cellulans J34]|nr:hypothetical protein L603_004900000060 [Cellulosimicrobium cellulans J34]SMF52419.1 hypothetical protein SAMN02744115_03721 [Cellulosimicrobium cellulans J1]